MPLLQIESTDNNESDLQKRQYLEDDNLHSSQTIQITNICVYNMTVILVLSSRDQDLIFLSL